MPERDYINACNSVRLRNAQTILSDLIDGGDLPMEQVNKVRAGIAELVDESFKHIKIVE
jgi:hypothetical protein